LVNFLDKHNIITQSQYGFRENSNTTHAIIDLIENIQTALASGKIPISIFIDLSKAFDTINHAILLNKLKHYGIRGIAYNWISNYLSNRKQYVHCNGVKSELCEIICGVPQGSILGPILFLIYINDLVSVSEKIKFILFADDTNIFYADNDMKNIKINLQTELEKVVNWFNENKLTVNISKTQYMIFKVKNINDFDLDINKQSIKRTNITKFLGVHLDDQISWKTHIESIEKKLIKNIRLMSLVNKKLDLVSLKLVYNTIILPHINYCAEVWGNVKKSQLHNLIMLQKRAIRCVGKFGKRTSTSSFFKTNKLLKLKDIIKYKLILLGYKANLHSLPQNIQQHFNWQHNVHNYPTRNRHKFTLKNCNTVSIVSKIINEFNNLPTPVLQNNNFSKFKNSIKQFIFNTY
jgi:hypothetical protein